MPESIEPTPYAVKCYRCKPNGDNLVFLDHEEYMRQLMRPDARWTCPCCGEERQWDDDNYENRIPLEVDEETGEPFGDE